MLQYKLIIKQPYTTRQQGNGKRIDIQWLMKLDQANGEKVITLTTRSLHQHGSAYAGIFKRSRQSLQR